MVVSTASARHDVAARGGKYFISSSRREVPARENKKNHSHKKAQKAQNKAFLVTIAPLCGYRNC
jgi:hypothetical protein